MSGLYENGAKKVGNRPVEGYAPNGEPIYTGPEPTVSFPDPLDPVDHDPVNFPAHYKTCLENGTNIECLDVIEALGLGYHLGNCLKYIWRADHKDARLEDLRKARFYLDRQIGLLENAE
jgi:hypothetical protein